MIQVNLLNDQRARAHERFAEPVISGPGRICLAISLLSVAAMGIWRFHLHGQVAADIEKCAGLRIAEAHLQNIRKQIEEHHGMEQTRQRKIDAIERLIEKQTDPLVLLNAILQSIPRDGDLWLTSLTQNSDSIRIEGFARNSEAIPDLMTNLGDSGVFDTIDLREVESQREASKFSLLCSGIRKTEEE